MARHPLPLETWGKVRRTKLASGGWRASARYRDSDGVTRTVQAFGPSGASAERSLILGLKERTVSNPEGVSRDMRLNALGELWFAEMEGSGRASRQTIEGYRDTYRRTISPALSGLMLRELTTGRLDQFLKKVAAEHPATARHSKVVLAGMLGLAVRQDAIPSNPIREVAGIRTPKRNVRALSIADVQKLRAWIKNWQDSPDHEGRPRATDLLEAVDVFLSTGARIGEVMALRWEDVDLDAEHPSLTISGTVTRYKGQPLFRQDHTKTAAGYRTVALPHFVVDTLNRMRAERSPWPGDFLFPSAAGTVRSPNNFRRQWRDAREGSGYEWVTPHVFRKTVATIIDREYGSKDAAAQLGHSGSAITERHYIEKAAMAPDLTRALEKFAALPPTTTPLNITPPPPGPDLAL